MIDNLFTSPVFFIINIFALLVAITVHEFSHALIADRLGDPTPQLQGRLTLNPLAHLDLYGTMFLLFFGFGWGKPVQFDPYNLHNPRKDAALISLGGPASNFIVAIVSSIILRLLLFFSVPILTTVATVILPSIIYLNIILGVFNLLPIEPLDGFKIVGGLLSEEKAREWYQLARYGIIFLLLLIIPINGRSMLSIIMTPIITPLRMLLIP